MKNIILTRGGAAKVDLDDFDRVSEFKWFCSSKGYAVRTDNKNRKCISMHRFILGLQPGKIQVDHINGDKLDNRRSNLRLANTSQNCANRWAARGRFPYKGIHYEDPKWGRHRERPFSARLRVAGKTYINGFYRTVEEAALAYNELAKKHHGEFAYLNKVNV